MAAYGSRRGKAARTGESYSDVILRLAASGEGGPQKKPLAGGGSFGDGGRQMGRLWPLGFFRCSSSNVALSITSPFGPSIFLIRHC
jgi:hypothetical protein